MLVEKITTHTIDGLDRLAQQYKDKPKIVAIHSAFYDQIQDLEDAIFEIDRGRQLWNGTSTPAIGKQLDEIGTIVGISRSGLSDAQYLLFIFGKIAENFSDSTLDSIATVVGYLFQAEQVIIQELPPAGLMIEAFGSLTPSSLFLFAKNLVKASMGGAVELVFAGASNGIDVFRLDGPTVNSPNGLGDVNNPLLGGKLIGTI